MFIATFSEMHTAELNRVSQGRISPAWNKEQFEMVADTAAWLFSFEYVSRRRFNAYLHKIILEEDWNAETAKWLYSMYLDKISATAGELAEKLFKDHCCNSQFEINRLFILPLNPQPQLLLQIQHSRV